MLYSHLTSDDVVDAKRALKEHVRLLENKAHMRTVSEDLQLANARAELRSIEREIKRRFRRLLLQM